MSDLRDAATEKLPDSATSTATADAPSAPTWPERRPDGRFAPGNLAAVRHALRTDRVPPEFAHLAAEVDEFVSGCLTDEGDESDVSTRRRALLQYRARLHRRIVQLDAAIETQGLFSRDGKLRVAWLQRLEGLITTAKALDSMLGLARRSKRVPTLSEYLDRRAASDAPAGDTITTTGETDHE